MKIDNRYCVIMAGGAGTRFWPISRTARPKQFLDVAETGKTFLQQTYERCLRIVPPENILVVSAERYQELVKEQLPGLDASNLLLEPYSRNTAPAVAYCTYALLKRNPEALAAIIPSDHIIDNDEVFSQTISKAFGYVEEKDVLMTLGSLMTVLFVGWRLKKTAVYDEFTNGGKLSKNVRVFGVLWFLIRYICPIAILAIFISGLI